VNEFEPRCADVGDFGVDPDEGTEEENNGENKDYCFAGNVLGILINQTGHAIQIYLLG
jgi:hypothetical protein